MQSLESLEKFRSLRLLSFKFRHRIDWTKLTKSFSCSFQSLGWFPIKGELNFELGLLRWSRRGLDPAEFFEKMVGRGLLYSLERLQRVAKNTYLVGFTGPYTNTVREKILEFGVPIYDSSIRGGTQEWSMVIDGALQGGFLDSLETLGSVFDVESKTPTLQELYRLVESNACAMRAQAFLLSGREHRYILEAKELGYFEDSHRIGVKDVARLLGRDPSTVDRGIRRGINKLVGFLTAPSLEQGWSPREAED